MQSNLNIHFEKLNQEKKQTTVTGPQLFQVSN